MIYYLRLPVGFYIFAIYKRRPLQNIKYPYTEAFSFKLLPSQKIKILHTQEVVPVFNFYRALHFFAKVLFAMVLKEV